MIKFKSLIPLQDLDLKADEARADIAGKKKKSEKMQAEVAADAQLLEKKQALLKKIQLRNRKTESEMNDLDVRIKSSEEKMHQSGMSPNVYSALEKELILLKEKFSIAETQVIEDMEKIEMLEKDTGKGEKVVAGRHLHLEQVKQRISDEIIVAKKELENLCTQRSQIALKIESDLLEIYEEIRHKKKSKVIFGIDGPSCPACGMAMPGGFANSITHSDEADFCSNCGVLLYWTGPVDL